MAEGLEIARVAVDPVVFTVSEGALLVMLNVREREPYKGRHELPGGLLLRGEEPSSEMERKLSSLFGGRDVYFTQFETFYRSDRDPRMRTISIGYIALVREEMVVDRGRWFPVSKLPALAFDHATIIHDASVYLKRNVSSLIARQLMPHKFPLNQLQRVYEAIEGKRYDNRNFRKKMINEGIVAPTNEFLSNSSYRPPRLYRFKSLASKGE